MPYNINETITDLPTLFKEVSGASSVFGTAIVVFVWIFIAFTGYFAQDRRTGKGSMPMWLTIGGFFTTMIAFVLFLIEGIVSPYVVVTTLIIFIVSAAWFMFSGDN
jgi:hypothetical protein